jgi:hypothetical protein
MAGCLILVLPPLLGGLVGIRFSQSTAALLPIDFWTLAVTASISIVTALLLFSGSHNKEEDTPQVVRRRAVLTFLYVCSSYLASVVLGAGSKAIFIVTT